MKMQKRKWLGTFIMVSMFFVSLFCLGVEASATETKTVVDSGTIPCVNDTDNVTWTLYNDGELVFSGNGTTDISNKESTKWTGYWVGELNESSVQSVRVEGGSNISLDTCQDMFYFFQNCKTINLTGFDFSKVTDMSSMFEYCKSLTSIDLGTFDTSKVTTMERMFDGCEKLEALDVSGFVTDNVTNMSYMFYSCKSVAELDVSRFVTDKVTDMRCMFGNCEKLAQLDVASFKTGLVTDMYAMFYACHELGEINVAGFDTSNVTDMGSMFNGCNSVTSLDVSKFKTENVTNMEAMFAYCIVLKNLDVSGFKTSKVTNMDSMFERCYALTSLNVTQFDTTNVTSMASMFEYCEQLKSINVTNFKTSNVTDMSSMFNMCKVIVSLDLSKFDTSKVTNMDSMFAWCDNIETINLSGFDTSQVTNMERLFSGCDKLKNVDITELETANVESMKAMFKFCDGFTSLDLSNFNTAKVKDMSYMFAWCDNLTTVDVSSFDTSSVETMAGMFENSDKITTLDVSKFKTEKVTDMAGMFNGCSSLQALNVSSFNTEKVKNMSNMFYGCKNLKSLDFSNFDTSKVLTFTYFADGCSGIDVMDYRSLDTSSAISPMKLEYTDELITPKTTTTFLFEGDSIWYDEAGNKYYGGDEKEIAPLTKLTRVNKYNKVYYMYGGQEKYLTKYEMELGLNEIPALSAEDLKDLGLDGYTFLSWYEDEALTIPVTSFAANVSGDNVIYPDIAGKGYTITYKNIKQASNKEVLPAIYEYGTALPLPQLESTCYTFVGWYLDEDLTQNISTITDTARGNLILYARWMQNPSHEIVESNKKDATCTELGYSGDYYCNTCQKMVIIGENLQKLPHDNSILKNAVEATCTIDGYTGDKHCKNCDTLVEQGESIAKKAHDVDRTQGTITVEPTTTTEGTMQYQCKNCDYTETEPLPKVGADFVAEQGLPEETIAVTDETILSMTNDNDVAGSSFVMIQARADKNTKTSVRLKWNKVKHADGYKVYGNKCGKKNRIKLIKTIENGTTTTYTQKKLKKGTYYKYIVRAYKLIDGKQVTIAVSKTIHSTTKGGKYGVAKSVKVKTDKKLKSKKGAYTLTIKQNKKYTIKTSEVKESKKIKQHRKIAYESSDTSIATVSSKGVVKGIAKGSCDIYVYAQNGVYKKIKVTVK